ncbi:MAG: hypothetical protein AAGA56_01620 [Myxococcota bacterium]
MHTKVFSLAFASVLSFGLAGTASAQNNCPGSFCCICDAELLLPPDAAVIPDWGSSAELDYAVVDSQGTATAVANDADRTIDTSQLPGGEFSAHLVAFDKGQPVSGGTPVVVSNGRLFANSDVLEFDDQGNVVGIQVSQN